MWKLLLKYAVKYVYSVEQSRPLQSTSYILSPPLRLFLSAPLVFVHIIFIYEFKKLEKGTKLLSASYFSIPQMFQFILKHSMSILYLLVFDSCIEYFTIEIYNV